MLLKLFSAMLKRLSIRLGRVPTLSYVLLYLLLILAFAVIYWILPGPHFYHSTSRFEYDNLNRDANRILEDIRREVVDVFKSHYGSSHVSFDGWEVDIDSVQLHSLSVADSPKEFSFRPTVPMTYLMGEEELVYVERSPIVTIPFTQITEHEDVFYAFPVIGEIPSSSTMGMPSEPSAAVIFPCEGNHEKSFATYTTTIPISTKLYGDIIGFGRGYTGFPSSVAGHFSRMLYLSAGIATSTAFGDIVPLTLVSRTLITMESIFALVLVGLFINAVAYDIAHSRRGGIRESDSRRGGSNEILQDIESIVRDILGGYEGTWPSDITDKVFLGIEADEAREQLYWDVVGELTDQGKRGQQIVNQYIGRRVKLLTTRLNHGRCYSPRSSLVKSYQRH